MEKDADDWKTVRTKFVTTIHPTKEFSEKFHAPNGQEEILRNILHGFIGNLPENDESESPKYKLIDQTAETKLMVEKAEKKKDERERKKRKLLLEKQQKMSNQSLGYLQPNQPNSTFVVPQRKMIFIPVQTKYVVNEQRNNKKE